jgi:hypothetical protein
MTRELFGLTAWTAVICTRESQGNDIVLVMILMHLWGLANAGMVEHTRFAKQQGVYYLGARDEG